MSVEKALEILREALAIPCNDSDDDSSDMVRMAIQELEGSLHNFEADLYNVLDIQGVSYGIFDDHPELKTAMLKFADNIDYSDYNDQISNFLDCKAEELGIEVKDYWGEGAVGGD